MLLGKNTPFKEVVEFANARMTSGQKILNAGGFIRNLLQNGSTVVNDTCQFNREYALEFAMTKNWGDLKIYEKYVKGSVTGDDLPHKNKLCLPFSPEQSFSY